MAHDKKPKIAVLGTGAWGTALACVVARSGRDVAIWGRNRDTCAEITRHHTNARYLSGIDLQPQISASPDMQGVVAGASAVLLVVPAQTTREVASLLFNCLPENVPVVCCSKGIDRETRLTPSQALSALRPEQPVAALSGPSFAVDVARGLPTAVTLASRDMNLSLELAQKLSGPRFRIYASDDLPGVELGGALKNVVALAVGVCRGLNLGASAEAAIIARGFREISDIAVALGGKSETLRGLSGLGDLVLSCSNELSRNFLFGMTLGQGKDTSDMPLAEGVKTVGVVTKIVRDLSMNCAVIETTDMVINGQISAKESVEQLLARPLRME